MLVRGVRQVKTRSIFGSVARRRFFVIKATMAAYNDKECILKKKEKKILKDSKNQKIANENLRVEEEMKERLETPMVQYKYQYAIDLLQAKLRLIDAELTETHNRPVIRNMSERIKTIDSIKKKLVKKGHEISYDAAVNSLNDIAGVRVVCYFCDDIYRVADALKRQIDISLVKEKDYVKSPKKSGYQSMHLILAVPVTYNEKTEKIRVEVQIRSFAMDYWAELDSQMCYKKSAGEIDNIERESRNYSDVIAKVDNQMLELRKMVEKIN